MTREQYIIMRDKVALAVHDLRDVCKGVNCITGCPFFEGEGYEDNLCPDFHSMKLQEALNEIIRNGYKEQDDEQ